MINIVFRFWVRKASQIFLGPALFVAFGVHLDLGREVLMTKDIVLVVMAANGTDVYHGKESNECLRVHATQTRMVIDGTECDQVYEIFTRNVIKSEAHGDDNSGCSTCNLPVRHSRQVH